MKESLRWAIAAAALASGAWLSHRAWNGPAAAAAATGTPAEVAASASPPAVVEPCDERCDLTRRD